MLREPIAICGMALRLPAGIKSPQQLWEFLIAGGDARSRVPLSRYNVDAFHSSSEKHARVISEYGYFLEDDLGCLDTSFFSMPRMEVERMDPQQRLLLEVVRECFEDAGEAHWRGKDIGCYVGSLGQDWSDMFARETQHGGPYRNSGYGDFALSNRISYEFDLKGPRYEYLGDKIW
jgi:acyl transferase domain-containing protein